MSEEPTDQTTTPATKPTWRARPCPICSKLNTEKYRPFCSKHCADVDLARWLKGTYAIPVKHDDEDEDGLGDAGTRPEE
jgi:endogenous inhibitor of DNA gyrase (YacG/DUF329 family)